MRQIWLFGATTLLPLGALVLGFAGIWAALPVALAYMTLVVILADQFLPLWADEAPEGAEFPAANGLLVVIGFAALIVLPLGVYAVPAMTAAPLWARGAGVLALGLWLGQVAVPAAHELIHRGSYRHVRLGVAVYTMLLFGHHASAHRLVHHRHVATPADPNTAREGEGFYAFFRRAWAGSYRAGRDAEARLRRDRAHLRGWSGSVHPYVVYTAGAAAALVAGYAMAGWIGVMLWAGLALHAQAQLLLSDYVQHYGLTRIETAGNPAPQSPAHSWNTAPWLSGRLTLNAGRHSDHHMHPTRAYQALRLPSATEAPRLPWSLPVACTLALVPNLWRRAIAPHLARAKARAAAGAEDRPPAHSAKHPVAKA